MPALKFNSLRKFHLYQSKTRTWESGAEQLEHYRLLFILAGEGHFLFDNRVQHYAPQGLIFLKPGEHPVFQESKNTEVFVISFDTYLADDFQKKKKFAPDFADTYKHFENLCNARRLVQGSALQNERDNQTIAYLINQIIFEVTQQPASHYKLIKGSIDLIVTILARNNFETRKIEEKPAKQDLTESIIEYLRNELHENKTIKMPELLMRFNVSEDVANLCVMNRTGMSVRNFIHKYKADLFKSRMLKVDVIEISPYLRPNA